MKRRQDEEKGLEREAAEAVKEKSSKRTERERHSEAEEQARWEEEYALEEDPDFAWQPTVQVSDPELKIAASLPSPCEASDTKATGPLHASSQATIPTGDADLEEHPCDNQGWDADFNKALSEGNNNFTTGVSIETDESIFAEFLEQGAFGEDVDLPGD